MICASVWRQFAMEFKAHFKCTERSTVRLDAEFPRSGTFTAALRRFGERLKR
jgi:hypothetical protein